LGTSAVAIVALAVVGRPSGAQQPTAPPSVVLTAADSASFKGPRQPVYFRHDIHAGQYQITCQYCHYSVAVDAEPGIPSMGSLETLDTAIWDRSFSAVLWSAPAVLCTTRATRQPG